MKELRARFNLSQEDLAKQVEVTRQTINAIERGRYGLSLNLAFRISRALKSKVEDVFLFEP